MKIEANGTEARQVFALALAFAFFGGAIGYWTLDAPWEPFVLLGLAVVGLVYGLTADLWRKRFRKNMEAVSPVIAVILMVAITVVLAATVFVLVSDIGGNVQNSAPAVAYSQDETQDRLLINSATQNADWQRLQISSNQTGVRIARNAEATGSSPEITTAGYPAATGPQKINGGDYLDFCGNKQGVEITIRDTTANAVVWRGTFGTIRAC